MRILNCQDMLRRLQGEEGKAWVWALVVIVVLALIIGAASGGGTKKGKPADAGNPSALAYTKEKAAHIKTVVDDVESVLPALSAIEKSQSGANMATLELRAQPAHDQIDSIRKDFSSGEALFSQGSHSLADYEESVSEGVNGLKDSMGAAVEVVNVLNGTAEVDTCCSAPPSYPEAVASFKSQYDSAVAKYNSGIKGIWGLAHLPDPPTLPAKAPAQVAPISRAVAQSPLPTWYDDYGTGILGSLSQDVTSIGSAGEAGDLPAAGRACQTLATDTHTAQGFPPPPNAQVAADWSAVLAAYSSSARECAEGAEDSDVKLIEDSGVELHQGTLALKRFSADYKAAVGQ